MKPIALAPPVAALALCALWLGSQRVSLSRLKDETTILRAHIEQTRQEVAAGNPTRADVSPGKGPGEERTIDWRKISKIVQASNQESFPDMKALIALRRRLAEMPPEELKAALEEIAALDLPADAARDLESMLIDLLAQKDPEIVLQRFADRLGDEQLGWQLSRAFRLWTKKDAAAAARWMDEQVAKNTFESKTLDGKNPVKLRFEAGLIAAFLESDPVAASSRLAAVPEDQRADLLRQGPDMIKPGTEKAFAELVRSQVPAEAQASTLASSASGLVRQGGYERVTEFLVASGASREERAAVVADSLRKRISNGNELDTTVEESREWILREAPEDAERLSGQALAHMSEWREFPELAQLAVGYQAESGKDDALVAFLTSEASRGRRDEALPFVDKIIDPGKREEVLKHLEKAGGVRTRATVLPPK